MTQAELLRYLVDTLDSLACDYLTPSGLPGLLERFPHTDFYVSEEAARDAVAHRGQFNIIHGASGVKIDLFVGKDTEYDRLRFQRRHRLPLVAGREAYFARPEDVILYKLLYFHQGGSDRHLRDIAGILAVSGTDLDLAYVSQWARRLGLLDRWEATQRR